MRTRCDHHTRLNHENKHTQSRFKLFLTLLAAKLRSGLAFFTSGEPSAGVPLALPSAALLLLAALAPDVVRGPCGRFAVGGCACRLVMSLA